jgi:outer membrane protein OmpA-like peptidoglycan-associated protein
MSQVKNLAVKSGVCAGLLAAMIPGVVSAQDALPYDNGITSYHSSPRYRESESHPLRIIGYVLHPIGWVAREVFFRPLSYFASSTETTRSIMGYREPYDYRQPSCFAPDASIPDCRTVAPFNYAQDGDEDGQAEASVAVGEKAVYFPDVNFDFNSRKLSSLGVSRAKSIAEMIQKDGAVKVVLQGHTDNRGSDDYNMKLGMDRAEAVRSELVANGVSADRLSTVSFGKSQPLFADDTDWARAANRRVDVKVDDGSAAK